MNKLSFPTKLLAATSRKRVVILAFSLLVICIISSLFLFHVYDPEILYHQYLWEKNGSNDYTITIDGYLKPDNLRFAGTRLEVCNGRVITVDGVPCRDTAIPDNCGVNPIKALFQEARRCGLSCSIEYDDSYDFPRKITYKSLDLDHILWAVEYNPIACQ